MANRRQGGGGGPAFDNSGYNNRRPGQGQQFGSPFESQNQRQNNFEPQFIPRNKVTDNYFGGNNSGGGGGRQNSGQNNFSGGGGGNIRNLFDRDDFGSSNSNPFVMDRNNSRGRDDSFDRGGVTNWRTRTPSPQRGRDGNQGSNRDDWNRGPQRFDEPNRAGGNMNNSRNNQGISGMGMNTMGNQSNGQPVVMVVPQANNGGAGLMGVLPVQATPNPFVQRQQPMQVILGNLPAFNADAIGQQILAAASARPQYGQGIMNGPQGGLMNQQNMQRNPQFQQQSQQRFDGGNQNSSGQYSHQNKNSPLQRNTANRRRSEPVSGSNNKSFNQGNRSTTATTVLRGNRKRVILRDRLGPTDEVDKKRPRTSLPAGRGAANVAKGKPKPLMGKKKDDKAKAAAIAAKKQNAKEADDKTKAEGDEVKAEGAEEKEGEGGEKEKKPSKFDEIPTSLLVCKICQKTMNDASSYESHLSGRAHLALVKILEERFKKRAELLMFESKISEEEIGIEKERQRRAGKNNQTGKGSKNFCKMCDCNYYANWGTHKVSIGHRLLKEFLHPNCQHCSSNFVHRVDWVNHLLSVGHLKKMSELKEKGVDIEESESTSQEELFVVNIEIGKDDKPTNFFKIRSSDYKAPSKDELKEMLKGDNGKFILPEGEIELPKEHEENTPYGEEAIMKLGGACCKVCRIYLASPEEVETHVRSKPHYGMYVSFLKKIIALREHKKAEEEKAAQLAAEKEKADAEAAVAAATAAVKEDAKVEGVTEEKADAGKEESMEVDETAVSSPSKVAAPAKSPVKSANTSVIEPDTETKTEEVKTEDAGKDESKMEEVVGEETEKSEEIKEEDQAPEGAKDGEGTPKKASSPAKTTPQGNRGQQRGRGNRGNRGTPRGSGAHNNRGGRGGMQTPQRGGATPRRGAASNVRGRGNRGGGGMDTPSWRGNRGRGSFR